MVMNDESIAPWFTHKVFVESNDPKLLLLLLFDTMTLKRMKIEGLF